MGSIDKACISGFLCRLCSEMHRIVIHIYGDQGQRLCLVEKINGYLPITISPTDPLPKTICTTCLRRVEQHYDLLMRLSRIKEKRFLRYNKVTERVRSSPISSIENSEDEVYQSDDESRRRCQELNISSQRQNPQQLPDNFSSSAELTVSTSFLATASESFSRNSFRNSASSANNDDNDSGASTSASALAAITQNITANINETNVGDSSSSSSTSSTTHIHTIEAGNSFNIVVQQHTD